MDFFDFLDGFIFSILEDFGENRGFDFPHLRGTVFGAQELVQPPEAAPESGVEVIFDAVVGSEISLKKPAVEHLGDLFPAIAMLLVGFEQYGFLLREPRFLVDFWVKVVMPSSI